jgi:hypothetical protein
LLRIPPPKSNSSCAGGFDEHESREHNPLDYVLFLYYIINKDINDMSGVESRVYNAIYDVSTKTAKGTWLPVLHARSIEQCDVKRISGLVHEENRVDLKNEIHDATATTAVMRDVAIDATAVRDVAIADLKIEIHDATAVMRDAAIAATAVIRDVAIDATAVRDVAIADLKNEIHDATAVMRDAAIAATAAMRDVAIADLKVFIENAIRDAASSAIHDAATAVTGDAATL